MSRFIFLLLFSFIFESVNASENSISNFKKIYKKLEIPSYQLAHSKNIESVLKLLKKTNLEKDIGKLNSISASCKESKSCKLLKHEVERLKRRHRFAKKLKKQNIKNSSELKKGSSLYKESYRLAISEWTNDFNFSYEDISHFQTKEIARIRKQLRQIKAKDNKKVTSAKEVIDYLEGINKRVEKSLPELFTSQNVPTIKIKLNENPKSQNVPGYYDSSSGTFFFSMPEGEVYLGDLDWLFLHEALPGHHLQIKMDKDSAASSLFNRQYVYLDFIEGWAAYVETYGSKLGIYQSPAAKRKALEWDLLRSTRVLIDIGLHLNGWSKERAKKEWKKLAPEVLQLADREIDRMIRWPAQVISYEYGKMKFIKAREEHIKQKKSLLSFHEKVLSYGQIPTSLL